MHHFGYAFACRHGKDADAAFGRRRFRSAEQPVFMLVAHVLYLDIVQRPPLLGRIQRIPGMLGVDVHFYYIISYGYNHGVAHILQGIADSLPVGGGSFYDKFRTVRILQICSSACIFCTA